MVLLKSTTLPDQSGSSASKEKNQSDILKESVAFKTNQVSEQELSSRDPNQKIKSKTANSEPNSLTVTAQPSNSAHKDKHSVSAVSSVPQHITHPNQESAQVSRNPPKEKRFKKHESPTKSSNEPPVHNTQSNGQTNYSWVRKQTDQDPDRPTGPLSTSEHKETVSGETAGGNDQIAPTSAANMPKVKADSKDAFDCKFIYMALYGARNASFAHLWTDQCHRR